MSGMKKGDRRLRVGIGHVTIRPEADTQERPNQPHSHRLHSLAYRDMMISVKRRVVLAVFLACVLIGLVAQASRVFLTSELSPNLSSTSFNPPSTVEPISPIPRSLPLDDRKIALGKRLFHDARLSRDNSVACSSCHNLAQGGVDGGKRSIG